MYTGIEELPSLQHLIPPLLDFSSTAFSLEMQIQGS